MVDVTNLSDTLENADWIRTPEAKARLQDILADIARERGISLGDEQLLTVFEDEEGAHFVMGKPGGGNGQPNE